jgi:hypothetical protein
MNFGLLIFLGFPIFKEFIRLEFFKKKRKKNYLIKKLKRKKKFFLNFYN